MMHQQVKLARVLSFNIYCLKKVVLATKYILWTNYIDIHIIQYQCYKQYFMQNRELFKTHTIETTNNINKKLMFLPFKTQVIKEC